MSIVLLILALLMSAVFGILQSSLQLADTVKAESSRELRVQKFVELIENTLNKLPADAVISIRPASGRGGQQMLEIAFALSPFDAATPGIVTIRGEADDKGPLEATLAFEEVPLNFAPTQRLNTARPVMLPLLKRITSIQWRVFDPQSQKWVESWNERIIAADLVKNGVPSLAGLPPNGQAQHLNPANPQANPDAQQTNPTAPSAQQPGGAANLSSSTYPRPPMLELSLAMDGEEPRRWIFWIPASVATP